MRYTLFFFLQFILYTFFAFILYSFNIKLKLFNINYNNILLKKWIEVHIIIMIIITIKIQKK